MKPAFALSLSADGIALLYRAEDGWRHVGSTPFDAEDLPAALAEMRADALRLAPEGVFSKLILPNDQIRYLTVETGEQSAEERIAAARAALEGATPYPVDELAFDISADGSLTHVAAVALETLDEAETFAVEHGFGPVSFVAAPEDSGFQGEPFFGTTRAIRGTEVEPDAEAVKVAGPAKLPDPVTEDGSDDSNPEAAADDPAPVQDPAGDQKRPAPQADNSEPASGADAALPSEETAQKPEADPAQEDTAETPPVKAAKAETPASLPPAPPPAAPAADAQVQNASGFSTTRCKAAAAANSAAPPIPAAVPAPQPEETSAPLAAARQPGPVPEAAKPLGAAVAAKGADQVDAAAPGPKIPPAPAALRESAPAPAAPSKPAADKPATKGKPRFLGLILTAILLLFMATVAVWAVFGGGGILSDAADGGRSLSPASGGSQAEETDGQTEPPALVPQPEADQDSSPIAPQVSVLADQPDPGIQETGAAAEEAAGDAALADTGPDPTAEDEAAADGAELPENGTDTALVNTDAAAEAVQDEPLDELALAARYAATGIWPVAPDLGTFPAAPRLDELYTASIDRTGSAPDAVALPQPETFALDEEPGAVASPAAAGADFDLDERGLVKATPGGTLNPDGITVYLGRPKKVPPPAPERSDPAAEALAEEVARNQVLSRKRPKARPADLQEQTERAQLGGLSRAELASLRPRQRPASLKPAEEEQLPATALAIAASAVPRERPANFANLVDRARRNAQNQVKTAAAVPAAAAAVAPRIPTTASVARRATVSNAINLRKLNLIGVYGTASDRRALVRLPSGRYKKVQVGDRIDGGRVIAIGENQLQYQKGGRNRTLKMPNG